MPFYIKQSRFPQFLQSQDLRAEDVEVINAMLEKMGVPRLREELKGAMMKNPKLVKQLLSIYHKKKDALMNMSKEAYEKVVQEEMKVIDEAAVALEE